MSTERYFHPNLKLMSNSSNGLLGTCARKYQLYKLQGSVGTIGQVIYTEETVHTDFGSIVGIGCQDYLVYRDYNKAVFLMFLSWKNMLDETSGEKASKTFWHALAALDAFIPTRNGELDEWQVPFFNRKPAIELGFTIDCGDGFKYRGKLDALLRSNRTKEYAVLDFKTTGMSNTHEAQWKNSEQGLGYSLVVDAISQSLGEAQEVSNYLVMYWQYKTKRMEWEEFRFNKSHSQRAVFIRSLLMNKTIISTYQDADFFPMNGNACFSFFSPCKWFDLCQLSDKYIVGNLEDIPVKVDSEEEYYFKFSLEDLIVALLEKGIG